MNTADMEKAARTFFDETWATHCKKSLTPQAKHELNFLFRRTLASAIKKGEVWDAAAQSYVGPKLAEIAANVNKASETPATDAVIERESILVITKYRPSSGEGLWCSDYELPSSVVCPGLADAENLFFATFNKHCSNLNGSGKQQLNFIFKRTVKHALCVKNKKLDPGYLEPKIADFAKTVQRSGILVGHKKLHEIVSKFIEDNQLLPPARLVWCVDYPQQE